MQVLRFRTEGYTVPVGYHCEVKAGEYVQRVNQPELAGIVRELRWDAPRAGLVDSTQIKKRKS